MAHVHPFTCTLCGVQNADAMYLVHYGRCGSPSLKARDLVTARGSVSGRSMTGVHPSIHVTGSFFGAEALFETGVRRHTIVTYTFCELFQLTKVRHRVIHV